MIAKETIRTNRQHYNTDFSNYSHKHYPLEKCHENKTLLIKVLYCLAFLASTTNPTQITQEGYCKKIERLNPRQDKKFLQYFDLPQCSAFFYLSFGNNKMGMAFAVDSGTRTIHILAIDDTHGIREYHGK